jgi:two-component system, OmpR family, phosphate regulon sensor histidine kinase PhoR
MLLLSGEIAGRPPLEIIRNAEIHQLLTRARASRSSHAAEIEVGGLKPRRLLIHVAPLSGEPESLLAVFVDVTELRRLETIRKDFVANVSHELRTPVAAIRSAAETVRGIPASEAGAAASFLEIIERNAERMGQLVQDLLDLSRIEAREFHFGITPILVQSVAEHILELFRGQAEAKQIRLALEIPPGISAVAADRRALEQILSNLVDNAIKYSAAGAKVTLDAAEEGGRIRLTVRDNGFGIEERHLPRLFERFYRVDPGRSRALGGTGLGLSIVRHLVEGMGGTVAVESTPGEGSLFTVSLPTA